MDKLVDSNTLFKIPYGLYVLTAKEGKKDNGCIINTVMQITNTPNRISIAVNKKNLTHDMIMNTKEFNVTVLTESVPFKVFEHFGFQSGRSCDKFESCKAEERSANGIRYIPKYSNAFISGKVTACEDYGTHTVFFADVTEAKILSDEKSVTYDYYFENIKPKPKKAVKGFECKICGYVYEGDTLPEDYECPLCGHGAEDFVPIY